MKYLKIYEEYSDEDLQGLIGDLQNVGLSRVPLDIDYGPYHGMGEKEKEGERNTVDNWSFEIPGGEDVRVKSGSIKVSPDKITTVILNINNGDVLELKSDDPGYKVSFSVNGKFPPQLQTNAWMNEEPESCLIALGRYENYLKEKYNSPKNPPTFFQRLKKKIGLDESDYSDEELRDLLGDMRHLQTYRIFESIRSLSGKQRNFLDKYTKGTWTLNPTTGEVDVDGDFDCSVSRLQSFNGIKFGKVSGSFKCTRNLITSLEGCPHTVGEDFECSVNKITSLEGGPKTVGGTFSPFSNFCLWGSRDCRRVFSLSAKLYRVPRRTS